MINEENGRIEVVFSRLVCLINRSKEAIQLEQHPRDLKIQFKPHLGSWQITLSNRAARLSGAEILSVGVILSGTRCFDRKINASEPATDKDKPN